MARCPAHGNRIQLNPSGAVNLFGATPQTDCLWIPSEPLEVGRLKGLAVTGAAGRDFHDPAGSDVDPRN